EGARDGPGRGTCGRESLKGSARDAERHHGGVHLVDVRDFEVVAIAVAEEHSAREAVAVLRGQCEPGLAEAPARRGHRSQADTAEERAVRLHARRTRVDDAPGAGPKLDEEAAGLERGGELASDALIEGIFEERVALDTAHLGAEKKPRRNGEPTQVE